VVGDLLSAGAMSKLLIEDVMVRFAGRRGREVTALDHISLAIPERELSCIVGPSGCGKTTLLRLIAGLNQPTSGAITLDGRPIIGPSAERGMVFQSYTLFQWLTVRRNVEFGLELKGMPAAERARIAAELIHEVGLDGFEHAYPEQLSGGMRQRTALARALANDPAILLMDEPFGALDSQTRALMQEMLLGIWEQSHKTVLFVTHDIDEALFLGDVVYVMTARPGRIKRELTVDLPRPRAPEILTDERFVALKREVLNLIREEAMAAIAEAAPA
jgi:ABC-type nitrate/sulfonate/bicarbonate transport system ATPase subunit